MTDQLAFLTHRNKIGQFVIPADGDIIAQQIDEILSDTNTTKAQQIERLEALIAKTPNAIDAYQELANLHYDRFNPERRLKALKAGIARCEALIPAGFKGSIPYITLDNRPYLRLLHHKMLSHIELKQYDSAGDTARKLLRLNPDDNFGVRFIVGSLYLLDGDIEDAEPFVRDAASDYPPSLYELGLLHAKREQWDEAINAFRKAFTMNEYLAKAIVGQPSPMTLPRWHNSNYQTATEAIEYFKFAKSIWLEAQETRHLIEWLFNHSTVLRQRAELAALNEQLLLERDTDSRRRLIEKIEYVETVVSTPLATKIDPSGRGLPPIYPWQYQK